MHTNSHIELPKRLSPISIIYRIIKSLPQFAIPIYFAINNHSTEDWIYIAISVFLGIIIFPFYILNYFYFSFQIREQEISIYSGIFSRKHRIIPFHNIQNVIVEQNLLHKIMGIAKVQIETAGDSQTEGVLDSVSHQDAERIKNFLNSAKNNVQQNLDSKVFDSERKDQSEETNYIFEISKAELVRFGAMRFRPLFFIFAVWIFSTIQQFNHKFAEKIGNYIEEYYESGLQNISITEIVFYVGLLIILALFLSWLMDIAFTFNQYYNYKVSKENSKLHFSFGLFYKKSSAIPLKRVQQIQFVSNFIKSKWGIWGLNIETAGFGAKQNNLSDASLPMTNLPKISQFAQNIFQFNENEEFKSVSEKTIRRGFIKSMLFFVPFVIILCFLSIWFVFLILLTPIFYYMSKLNYQKRLYYFDDNYVQIKEGYFFNRYTIIPINKIQSVQIRQTFFQRKLNLATLNIDTAASTWSNDAKIIDIENEEAEMLFNNLSQILRFKKINTDKKR